MTDQDVVVATPPTNDDDEGRLEQWVAEELVQRARAEGVDLVGPGGLLAVIEGLELGDRVVPTGVPHGNYNGVAANDRAIYVSEDGTNSVHEFKR